MARRRERTLLFDSNSTLPGDLYDDAPGMSLWVVALSVGLGMLIAYAWMPSAESDPNAEEIALNEPLAIVEKRSEDYRQVRERLSLGFEHALVRSKVEDAQSVMTEHDLTSKADVKGGPTSVWDSNNNPKNRIDESNRRADLPKKERPVEDPRSHSNFRYASRGKNAPAPETDVDAQSTNTAKPKLSRHDRMRGALNRLRSSETSAPSIPSSQKESQSSETYYVQVGSFSDRDDASELIHILRAKGYQVRRVAAEVPEKGTYHRVQVTGFSSKAAAHDALSRLSNTHKLSGFVRKD